MDISTVPRLHEIRVKRSDMRGVGALRADEPESFWVWFHVNARERSIVGRELALRPGFPAPAGLPPTALRATRRDAGVTGFDCGAGAVLPRLSVGSVRGLQPDPGHVSFGHRQSRRAHHSSLVSAIQSESPPPEAGLEPVDGKSPARFPTLAGTSCERATGAGKPVQRILEIYI